ncbi:hypothetical protein FBU59_001657 [Linderina macrospora]|uniref:Uncharacterized protein n=1 Tax=Linderina macrospora TaxID=4868 RepID=A0ACC1JDI5_9FUNG|nr:hypothetical protein FBU59_001657 [Linderina macrospora]
MATTLSVSTARPNNSNNSNNPFTALGDSQQSTSPDGSTSTAHSTVICTPVASLQQSLHIYSDDDDSSSNSGSGAIPMSSMREAFGGYVPAGCDNGAPSTQKDQIPDVQRYQRLQKLTSAEFDKLHFQDTTELSAASRDYHADAALIRDSSSQSGDESSYVRHPTLVFDGSPILRASVLVDSVRDVYDEQEDREVHGFTVIPRLHHNGTNETFVESDSEDLDDHLPLDHHHQYQQHRPSVRPRSYTDIPAHRPAHDNTGGSSNNKNNNAPLRDNNRMPFFPLDWTELDWCLLF